MARRSRRQRRTPWGPRARLVREILRRSDRWSERSLLAITEEELRAVHEAETAKELGPAARGQVARELVSSADPATRDKWAGYHLLRLPDVVLERLHSEQVEPSPEALEESNDD